MVNKYSNIEHFFQSYLEISTDMLERLSNFRINWSIKRIDSNYTNLDFLSGITMGVQNVRFSNLDESILANDVLRVDLKTMQNDFYRVEGIVKEWKVSSNVIYQILLYIIRYVLINKLDVKYILDAYLIMAYKMLTSMIEHRFDYPLDPRIASVVAEKMTNKFIVKQLGSWAKYLEYRATFIMPGSDHANLLLKNYTSETTLTIIPDLQTNLKSTVNRLFSLIVEISGDDLSIDNTTLVKVVNEELVLSDVRHSVSKYSRIAVEKIHTKDFANDNYIYLLTNEVSPGLNASAFKTLLTNISNSSLDDFDTIDGIVYDCISTAVSYLTRVEKAHHIDSSIIEVMKLLKPYYSSSTVKDAGVLDLKKRSFSLIENSTTIKTSWILTSLNINFILYIILTGLLKR